MHASYWFDTLAGNSYLSACSSSNSASQASQGETNPAILHTKKKYVPYWFDTLAGNAYLSVELFRSAAPPDSSSWTDQVPLHTKNKYVSYWFDTPRTFQAQTRVIKFRCVLQDRDVSVTPGITGDGDQTFPRYEDPGATGVICIQQNTHVSYWSDIGL